ncbi:MAG TPA: SRPBCC family protein [Jiangellaceae bacterium]
MVVDGLFGVTRPDEGGRYAVRFERRFRADPVALWSVITEPDQLRHWLAPVSGELREGGEFEVGFVEGGRARGTIETCRPESRLELSWAMDGDPAGRLVVELEADDAGSRLVADHAGIVEHEYLRYAAGWQTYLEQIDPLLSGHDYPDWWDRYRHLRRRYAERAAVEPTG